MVKKGWLDIKGDKRELLMKYFVQSIIGDYFFKTLVFSRWPTSLGKKVKIGKRFSMMVLDPFGTSTKLLTPLETPTIFLC